MRIMGNPVGRMAPKANWAQTNTNMADYIRNKPDLSAYALQADLESASELALANRENIKTVQQDITTVADNVNTMQEDVNEIKANIPDMTLSIPGKAADAKATGEAINKVSEDTAQMVNDAKDQLTTDLQAADRIIECGIDGDLTWEKWTSGKAVCWGTAFLGDVAATKAWGSWYESVEYTIDFPAGLFATTPKIIDITVKDADSALFVARYGGDATAENTGKFTLSRPLSRNVLNVTVGLIAIGVWKVDEPVVEEEDE